MSSMSMSVKQCLLWLLTLTGFSCGNYPLLDVDTNMRIVLVPHDTPVGSIIYRLRASDSDNNFPLSFEVLGAVGKSLLSLNFLGCVESESLCQADVVLKKTLDIKRTYEFQIQVKDTTGDYTKVHATLTSTMGTSHFNSLFGPRIIHLAEDCKEETVLERFEVLKNDLNSRVVHLEIRDAEERIGLKQRLVSNNMTEGTLFLRRKLDYETQPWFTFQLLAMNGWTNTSVDTRNILVSDVIVAVHDVQDTPPTFTLLPASVELNSGIKMGDLVVRVEAVDGDKQNKRLIRYGFLTESNPFVVFFDLDPMTGEIRLRRNITELLGIAKPNEPIRMTVIAEEIVQENGRYGRSLAPSLERTMGNITFWFGRGTSLGPPIFSSDRYIGEVEENSLPGTPVRFGPSTSTSSHPGLSVSHPNPGEVITLSISGKVGGGSQSHNFKGTPTRNQNQPFIGPINANAPSPTQSQLMNTFELIPTQGVGNFSFEIRVADPKLLDYEVYHEIKLVIMGTTQSGLFQEVEVTIHLRDENDNQPAFTQSEYRVEIPEHSPVGTKVITVKATDKDGGSNGEVVYANLVGSAAFHLDPVTGEITVDKPELLDREVEPEIRLYVEAKDGGYTEFSNPSTVRNMATATIVVKLHDKNDNAPEFLQKYYQAVLNPDMTSFKSPVFVKAYDPDEGTNGQIKYQSLDPKFFVDPGTGEVRIRGAYNRNPAAGDGPYLGAIRIRAYDLGNPQQSSETVIQLFSEEMVTREIQFVFPATPDKIRQNQTNIEKMLSSLTGGIVGIQKITSLGSSSRSGLVDGSRRLAGDTGAGDENNNRIWPPRPESPVRVPNSKSEQSSTRSLPDPGESPGKVQQPQPQLSRPENANSNGGLVVGAGADKTGRGRAADLSSEKSLVTATVQYPVSSTPTRVDLAAFQRAYGSGNGDGSGEVRTTDKPHGPDADMIKLYEAENRALFWILITFLFLLLILFGIFLCCIYCPCCWLYGHCYSKGVGDRDIDHRSEKERVRVVERVILEKRGGARHPRKTYPADNETEDSAGYDNDPESGTYRRGGGGAPPRRREAWSGDADHKGGWRGGGGGSRRYRERPPTPHGKNGRGKQGRSLQDGDVALEDWDFDPNHTRAGDRSDEIGPRWQNMQHHGQQPGTTIMMQTHQPQTITVPVPMSMMPAAVQQQLQQQIPSQPQRRVGYVGHEHPGDEDYVRRRADTSDQQPYIPSDIARSQIQIPRHYPGGGGGTAPVPDSGIGPRQRETRFFKTEAGEVLQFADMEDEEGKELLMKRYIDDQQQQQKHAHRDHQLAEGFTGPLVQLDSSGGGGDPHRSRSQQRREREGEEFNETGGLEAARAVAGGSIASDRNRPRAALAKRGNGTSKRGGGGGGSRKEVEMGVEDDEDEILIRDEKTTKSKSRSKHGTTTTASKGSKSREKVELEKGDDDRHEHHREREKEKAKEKVELEGESRSRHKDVNKDKNLKSKRRSHSLSEGESEAGSSEGDKDQKNRKKSELTASKSKSKSLSRSRSKSKSTSKSKSRSKSRSRSRSRSRTRSSSPGTKSHSKSKSKSKSPADEEVIVEPLPPVESVEESITTTRKKQGSKSLRKGKDPTPPPPPKVVKVGDEHKTHRKSHRSTRSKEKEQKEKSPPVPAIPLVSVGEEPSAPQVGGIGVERSSEPEVDVDINIIPPSSGAMSDENENDNRLEKSGREISPEGDQPQHQHQDNDIDESLVNPIITTSVQNEILHENDDEDSGIGISGVGAGGVSSKRNKMLEKKSVFTIAYDEVAQKSLMRPDTGNNSNNEENGEVAS